MKTIDADGKISLSVIAPKAMKAVTAASLLAEAVSTIQIGCAKLMISKGHLSKDEVADAALEDITLSDLGLI